MYREQKGGCQRWGYREQNKGRRLRGTNLQL